MTADALPGERRIFSIGLQVSSTPPCESPAQRICIFLAVTDHEFHLEERSRPNGTCTIQLLKPRHLDKCCAVGPRIDLIVRDRINCDIVTEHHSQISFV